MRRPLFHSGKVQFPIRETTQHSFPFAESCCLRIRRRGTAAHASTVVVCCLLRSGRPRARAATPPLSVSSEAAIRDCVGRALRWTAACRKAPVRLCALQRLSQGICTIRLPSLGGAERSRVGNGRDFHSRRRGFDPRLVFSREDANRNPKNAPPRPSPEVRVDASVDAFADPS